MLPEAGSELSTQPDGDPGVEQSSTTWRALTAFASEQHHALRHAFDSGPAVETTGKVHHQQETSTTDHNSSKQRMQTPGTSLGLDRALQPGLPESQAALQRAVEAEVEQIQQRTSILDLNKDVVVNLDFMQGGASRAASLTVIVSLLIAATVLLAQVIKKFQLGDSLYQYSNTTLYKWHVAVAVMCLATLTAGLANLMWHVSVVVRQKKSWWPRRKRILILHATEAAVQWVNLVFYLAPNVYVLHDPCNVQKVFILGSGFVEWTCWNTIFMLFLSHGYGGLQRHNPESKHVPAPELPFNSAKRYGDIINDGPIHLLWPCLIPWLLFEADMAFSWLHTISAARSGPLGTPCEAGQTTTQCHTDKATRIGVDLAVALATVYFAATCSLLWYKLRWFKQMPYAAVKKGIVYFTLQLWLRSGVMAYFLLCMILLWLVNVGSCASNKFVWTGIMPMHIVATMNAIVLCYVSTPVNPGQQAVAFKVWLQEPAWTEADKPIKLAARSAILPSNSKMEQQPMFCYETMLNMLYWSCLIYDHDRGKRSVKSSQVTPVTAADAKLVHSAASSARTILTLETAMSLYGLTDSESFWEMKQDTRCLVSWGGRHVVVAFRGTASMKNALADLQAWRVAHPPARGNPCMGSRPLVHVGFLKSWLAGSLNEKVVTAVVNAVHQCRNKLSASQKIIVLVTGHSLGGAVATLAAYDIQKSLQRNPTDNVEVICYNFAAPRTGNHAFAQDYNAVVPDTWSVINDQDVVTREGKLLCLYKRPGHRVIIDAKGRLIVRPTHMEASVQRNTAGQSMKHHLLSSYFHAVLSVALAQFGTNGFPSGMAGIIRLAEKSPYVQDVLESQMGMQLSDMQRYSQLGAAERAQHMLPGSHPPVKGFYLIKPSPSISSSKSIGRSQSLLTRIRHPRRLSSTNSLVPSLSASDFGSMSGGQVPDPDDISFRGKPDFLPEGSAEVVVHIDDTDEQLTH